jgi:hypothetical protein
MKKRNALLVAALAGSFIAAHAQAVSVRVELSLLVDVSGSIDATEYNLQRTGYANAFSNASFYSSVVGAGNAIAVNFIQWSGAAEQSQSVGWTLINSQASANAFAAAILAAPRPFSGQTAPGNAINFGAPLFNNNGFEGIRKIMDVSGDGSQNDGVTTSTARNNALAAGINAINGLAILGSEANLDTWYAANVQGGAGSFTIAANGFADFGNAIERKLRIELGGPLPGAVGTGLATMGLVTFARRRRQMA